MLSFCLACSPKLLATFPAATVTTLECRRSIALEPLAGCRTEKLCEPIPITDVRKLHSLLESSVGEMDVVLDASRISVDQYIRLNTPQTSLALLALPSGVG